MNTPAQLNAQLLQLLEQMRITFDEKRWRRMPALRQQLMACFDEYQKLETNVAELAKMKCHLRDGFAQLIAQSEQRAAELEHKMAQHRDNQEGVLAYSMMALLTEQP